MSVESVFFEKTYKDAIRLLERAQGYAQSDLHRQLELMEPLSALYVSSEVMRITARLTQVIAWLMAQKAASYGEISVQEATSKAYHPNNSTICLKQLDEKLAGHMPSMVVMLSDDSYRLYVRVTHLADLRARAFEQESPRP